MFFGFGYSWVMSFVCKILWGFNGYWLRRTARVSWIINVIQVFKFIGFVYVIRAVRVIITLNEYAKGA